MRGAQREAAAGLGLWKEQRELDSHSGATTWVSACDKLRRWRCQVLLHGAS